MKINKLYIIIGLLLAFGLFFIMTANASERNEETVVTFHAPVQIAGQQVNQQPEIQVPKH